MNIDYNDNQQSIQKIKQQPDMASAISHHVYDTISCGVLQQ